MLRLRKKNKKTQVRWFEGIDPIYDFDSSKPKDRRKMGGWYTVVNEGVVSFYVHEMRGWGVRSSDGSKITADGSMTFRPGDTIYIKCVPYVLGEMRGHFIPVVTVLNNAKKSPKPGDTFFDDNIAIAGSEVIKWLQAGDLVPAAK